MKLVITGTPCTGKTTLAKELSTETGWPAVDLNALVKKEGLHFGKQGNEYVADLEKLRKRVLRLLAGKRNWIVEGHLACEFALPAEVVVVLRVNPPLLFERMKKRKYALNKIKDNLFCEILDYCLLEAESRYDNTPVIQADNSKPVSAKELLSRTKMRKSDRVDWSHMLHDKKLAFLLKERL
ncbi:AAA family ATPase [Candidatus Micrarchaeota archaeon]|nr:AAA family ATPase [Candidatus Micrarchaeota archaeon]